MVNQNNSNRVTPNETININLQPQASPVDKTIAYQPDLSDAKKSAATADSLAKIGQGAFNYDVYLKREAADTMLNAVAETEAQGGNKKEWADVSKNVQGVAKFNPYIKDSYRTLTAQNIYRSSVLKLSANPNLEKMNSEDFNKFITDTKNEMFTAIKEAKIDPKNYINYVEKFNTDCYNISQAYVAKNSEYNYKNSLIEHSADLGFQLGVNSFNAKSASSKTEAITVALNSKLEQLSVLGTPKDDVAQVIATGIKSYIVNNDVNAPALEASIRDLKINGQPINEIVPNFNYEVHQMIREARRTQYEERQVDYENEQLTLKINTKDANKDFFNWYKQNPKATPAELQTHAMGLIDKFGLQEDGFGFLAEVVKDRSIFTRLKTVESNPDVQQELGALAVTGKLTGERIEKELLNGNLNIDDGLKLHDRIDREAKAEVKALEVDLNQFDTQLKDNGVYGTQLKRDPALIQMRNKVNQLKVDLDAGRITKEQAQTQASYYAQYMNEYLKMKATKNKNEDLLLNANYLRGLSYPTYNEQAATSAFKKLGFTRGSYGQRVANITSGINPNRTINGKKSPHSGYDLAATEGTPILNTYKPAVVVRAGYLPDFGNYVVLKYSNGNYCRMGHLNNITSGLLGKTIQPQERIGYVGNTGATTGAHLHTDFLNKNFLKINVETFAKGL